ncbi:Hypothetical protein NocV09_12200020, partial [Nannochloropsis oceanica]
MPAAEAVSQPQCATSSAGGSTRRRKRNWHHYLAPLLRFGTLLPLLLSLLTPSKITFAFPITARFPHHQQQHHQHHRHQYNHRLLFPTPSSSSSFSSVIPSASSLSSSSFPSSSSSFPSSIPTSLITTSSSSSSSSIPVASSPLPSSFAPTISFPGGGIFFYWQAGAVHYLQQHFNLREANLVGASAGALTAVLTGCDVCMPLAAERALSLSMSIALWARPLGLVGVWGALVGEWLRELLPEDAAEQCKGRVQLYVNVLELKAMLQKTSNCLPLRRTRVSDFESRHELVETCLASVHIPFFMVGGG